MYQENNFVQFDNKSIADTLFKEYILKNFSSSFVESTLRQTSNSLIAKESALTHFSQVNPDFQWNKTFIEHFSFNGEYVEFSLNNSTSENLEGIPAILRFKAKNLVIKTNEYEYDDDKNFINVDSRQEENEHLNDIINDYTCINELSIIQNGNNKSIVISFINDQFNHDDNEENEHSEYADIFTISFDFNSVAIVDEFLNDD